MIREIREIRGGNKIEHRGGNKIEHRGELEQANIVIMVKSCYKQNNDSRDFANRFCGVSQCPKP